MEKLFFSLHYDIFCAQILVTEQPFLFVSTSCCSLKEENLVEQLRFTVVLPDTLITSELNSL
jgi:hypothetical protein